MQNTTYIFRRHSCTARPRASDRIGTKSCKATISIASTVRQTFPAYLIEGQARPAGDSTTYDWRPYSRGAGCRGCAPVTSRGTGDEMGWGFYDTTSGASLTADMMLLGSVHGI